MRDAVKVLLILLLLPPVLSAQADTPAAVINQAYVLEQHGQAAEAVAVVNPLVDSGELRGAQLGRAGWQNLLAASRKQ